MTYPMKNFSKLFLAAAVLFLASPAFGAEQTKISNMQALQALVGLRNLDGHQVVVKQSGQDAVVLIPWEFKNAALRLALANDVTILASVEQAVEKVRQEIVKEIGKGAEIKPGTPEMAEFTKQYEAMMAAPAAGTQDLSYINDADLRLDVNEIGVTTLSALAPIRKK